MLMSAWCNIWVICFGIWTARSQNNLLFSLATMATRHAVSIVNLTIVFLSSVTTWAPNDFHLSSSPWRAISGFSPAAIFPAVIWAWPKIHCYFCKQLCGWVALSQKPHLSGKMQGFNLWRVFFSTGLGFHISSIISS